MINLLPNDTQKQIRAARANVKLINYIFVALAAITFLALSCYVVFLYLNNVKTTNEAASTNQSSSDRYNTIKNQVSAMNSSILKSKLAFSQQITYSNILLELGRILPQGVIIDSLSLNNSDISSQTTMKLHSQSDDTAAIKNAFAKSNLFSLFEIESTTSTPTDPSGYPITINALLIINKAAAK